MKVLILAVYPAPYRVELFKSIEENIDADIFFEYSNGDGRSKDWFIEGHYQLLDNECGRKAYKIAVSNIKEYSLVIIYDYSTKEGIKLTLTCQLNNVSYIINSDGLMISKHKSGIKDLIKVILLRKASACFASGQNAKEYFMKYGVKEEKIHRHTFSDLHKSDILVNPIEQNEKKIIRKRLKLPEDCKIVLAVGRFIPLKRYNELIEAWDNMPTNYLLLLIGGGQEEGTYRNTIQKLQLNNVRLERYKPKRELFDYYKAADVFVHPTSFDVWGLVINEAMACSLPVVVSDRCVAGLELIKNGENGYIVPMGNDEEMCERVRDICESGYYESIKSNSLETIRQYTIENMAEAQISVIRSLVSK